MEEDDAQTDVLLLEVEKMRQQMAQQQRIISKLLKIRNSPRRTPSPKRRGDESSSDDEGAAAAAPVPASHVPTKTKSTPSYRKGSPRRSPRRRSTQRKSVPAARRKLGSPNALSLSQRQSRQRKRSSTPASGGDQSPPKIQKSNSVTPEIKRTNSFTRLQKTPEEQTMRKRICNAMYIFDNRLSAGDFWDASDGCFNKEEFEAEATPLINELVGENVQAAGMYWEICLDVVKRRRRYLLKKLRGKKKREAALRESERLKEPVAKGKTTANGVKSQTTVKGNPNPNPNPNPNTY